MDDKRAQQIAVHFCTLACDSDDFRKAQKPIMLYAIKSHRAKDLGLTNGT